MDAEVKAEESPSEIHSGTLAARQVDAEVKTELSPS